MNLINLQTTTCRLPYFLKCRYIEFLIRMEENHCRSDAGQPARVVVEGGQLKEKIGPMFFGQELRCGTTRRILRRAKGPDVHGMFLGILYQSLTKIDDSTKVKR